MVPRSLMFRVSTAGRQAQLRLGSPTPLLRYLHNTTRVRSPNESASKDAPIAPIGTTAPNPIEASDSTPLEPLSREFHDAIDDIIKSARPRGTRSRKVRLGEDGEALLPNQRARRKPSAVAANSDTSAKPPKRRARVPAKPKIQPDGLVKPARRPAKPKIQSDGIINPALRQRGRPILAPPNSPHDNLKDYLQWGYGGNWQGGRAIGDRKRMNLISEDACDAILTRMKPSLEKHIGCDVLDINPGAGVWSRKLHDFLKPRTHILMEPDIRLCGPLLQPLVEAPDSTYRLFPKSGLVWGHLEGVLCEEHLPFQTAYSRDDPRLEERNDTLLVNANIGYYPGKMYKGFNSLAQMVIYQFMSAIKAHSLFEKYGLVRILVWMNDEERHNILPRSMSSRRKASVEAAFSCEKLEEVASGTEFPGNRRREEELDFESIRNVLQRMKTKGIDIPKGRESLLMQKLPDVPASDAIPYHLHDRADLAEYTDLEKQNTSGKVVDQKRLTFLKGRLKTVTRKNNRFRELCNEYEAATELLKAAVGMPDSAEKDIMNAEFQERLVEWEGKMKKESSENQTLMTHHWENRSALRRDNPLLVWDRREVEPLRLYPEEFYPAKTMCLFDIQPKTLAPVLREDYPNNYDILEYILVSFYVLPSQSVKHGLTGLVPGAYEWIEAECPSLKDPRKGGHPNLDQLTVRCVSEEMLLEIVEAWLRWPFRPTRYELLSRMGGSVHDPGVFEADEIGQASTE